jgi:hypothetical protein
MGNTDDNNRGILGPRITASDHNSDLMRWSYTSRNASWPLNHGHYNARSMGSFYGKGRQSFYGKGRYENYFINFFCGDATDKLCDNEQAQ